MMTRAGSVRSWNLVPLLLLAASAAIASGDPPPPSTTSPSSAAAGAKRALDNVRAWLGSGAPQSELLPADEAFRLEVRVRDTHTLVATLTPANGYYLYRDRVHFRIEDPPGIAVEAISLPDGEPKQDPTFGQVAVYRHPVDALIHVSGSGKGPLHLYASYQGCNEARGVCYPPIEKSLTVIGASAPAGAAPSRSDNPKEPKHHDG